MKSVESIVAQFRQAIGSYMLVQTDLAKADIGFVFGNIDTAEELASHAADLYHQGYFTTVLLSGGVTKGDVSEAERMRNVMLQKGVPQDAMILEDRASNTGQNVTFGLQKLEETVGLSSIRSVLAVGALHASRRFLMSLEKQWPGVVKMFSTVNSYTVEREAWHSDPVLKALVMTEMHKIGPYEQDGFIAEIDVDSMNRKIASLPKPV